MNQLFFCATDKRSYLLRRNNINCNKCGDELKPMDTVIVQRSFRKKSSMQFVWCKKCIKYSAPKGIADTIQPAIIVDDLPNECVLVPPTISLNSGSNTDVWNAAISNKGIESTTTGVKIIDNTLLAGRDTSSVQMIDVNQRLKELDKPISEKEAIEFIDKIKKSKPRKK